MDFIKYPPYGLTKDDIKNLKQPSQSEIMMWYGGERMRAVLSYEARNRCGLKVAAWYLLGCNKQAYDNSRILEEKILKATRGIIKRKPSKVSKTEKD